MKYLLILLTLTGCLALSGCATVTEPQNECRLTLLNGEGRYGTFTQYVEGDVVMVRLTTHGKKCPGATIDIVDTESGVTVNYSEDKADE